LPGSGTDLIGVVFRRQLGQTIARALLARMLVYATSAVRHADQTLFALGVTEIRSSARLLEVEVRARAVAPLEARIDALVFANAADEAGTRAVAGAVRAATAEQRRARTAFVVEARDAAALGECHCGAVGVFDAVDQHPLPGAKLVH
jgi:hypothetical protein